MSLNPKPSYRVKGSDGTTAGKVIDIFHLAHVTDGGLFANSSIEADQEAGTPELRLYRSRFGALDLKLG